MLHALEALSRALTIMGRYGEAVEAALTAIVAEPLRESAQRALLEAHLAESNLIEARRDATPEPGAARTQVDHPSIGGRPPTHGQ